MAIQIERRHFNEHDYRRMVEAGILAEADRAGKDHLFTVAEYHRLLEAGILGEDDRVELIEGEIVQMTPIGSRHAACVKRLISTINTQLGQQVILGVQDPIELGSLLEPQPDISLLRPQADYYESSHPKPADILLLIEVADTTQNSDRDVKAPLYAANEIPEYWLVNLTRDNIEVYTQPANGKYQRASVYRRGDTISSQNVAGLVVGVNSILG